MRLLGTEARIGSGCMGKQDGVCSQRSALAVIVPTIVLVLLQEAPAVMFCSEDRALICRQCDLMIHTANEFTAKHHR